jgi:hypothetical protein
VTDATGGLHVALLGMDGLGKSSRTRELAERVRASGRAVHLVSWRRFLEQDGPRTYPRDELERLWVQSFRLYFGGATTADGTPLDLPTSYRDLNARGGTEYLNGTELAGMHGAGPLAAAWVELAANTLLHRAVIRPLVEAGAIVLQESYGYKHLAKLLALAAQLSPELTDAARAGQGLMAAYFGGYLVPDVGIHLSGDPALALKWRMSERGRLGLFESLASAGADPAESFLRVQGESAGLFAEFARANGWVEVTVVEAEPAVNRERTLRALAGTPLAGLIGVAGG